MHSVKRVFYSFVLTLKNVKYNTDRNNSSKQECNLEIWHKLSKFIPLIWIQSGVKEIIKKDCCLN